MFGRWSVVNVLSLGILGHLMALEAKTEKWEKPKLCLFALCLRDWRVDAFHFLLGRLEKRNKW